MSRFTERLWQDLVREHGGDLDQIGGPAPRHSWRRRPRLLAGTGLGVMAAGTLAALALSAGSSPAFAVTRNADGTVNVVITRITGIQGANAKLAALGLRARFVQMAAGCGRVTALRPAGRLPRPLAVLRAYVGPGWVHARIDPRRIPAGQLLVVVASARGRTVHLGEINAASGVVPRCLPVPLASGGLAAVAGNRLLRCTVGPRLQGPIPVAPPSTTGNSGSGPSTTGNSGTGPSTTGNSGSGPSTTGNSGTGPSTTGNSGSAPPMPAEPGRSAAVACLPPPLCAAAVARAPGVHRAATAATQSKHRTKR